MYSKIEIVGGLCNKLFQIAFLISRCNKTGDIPVYDSKLYTPAHHETVDWSYFIRNIMKDEPQIENYQHICETSEQNYKYVEYGIIHNAIYHGYFQSYKYFQHIRDNILQQFRAPLEQKKNILEKYPDLYERAFIHIRRGDNINNAYHYVDLDSKYYPNSISKFSREQKWIICSDGIDWCKSNWPSEMNDVIFIEEDEITTLWIMSLCGKGGIAANSTFSWWGLYLNENVDVLKIVPNKVLAIRHIDTTEYYPPEFTIMDV